MKEKPLTIKEKADNDTSIVERQQISGHRYLLFKSLPPGC